MKKHAQKAWFPSSHLASIKFRSISQWDVTLKAAYFETWEAAHQHMLDTGLQRVKRAKADLKSAERYLDRVRAMPNKQSGEPT